MQTKPLLCGIIGFILGGLIVSVAAVTIEKSPDDTSATMDSMVTSLQGKKGEDFDKVFISGMIVHHQGAIDMARMAQANARHQEVKTLADAIITSQTKDIKMMQGWQMDWHYPAAPSMDMMAK